MKFFKIILLFFLINSTLFSQEKYTKHTISKGETISSIADKYNVKPSEIYKLNPKAKGLLKLNSVLKIPENIPVVKKKQDKRHKKEQQLEVAKEVFHHVLPKETLYGISKQYGVTIEDIKTANPIVDKERLVIGLKLIIPIVNLNKIKPQVTVLSEPSIAKQNEVKPTEILNNQVIEHEVLPKQTKYGIAKQYDITIQELENQNPNIVNGLPVGYKLKIRNPKGVSNSIHEEKPIIASTTEVVQETVPVASNESVSVEKVEEVKNENPLAENSTTNDIEKPSSYATKLDFLVANASENIGVRYRSGGTSKAGFDCSGLMITTFNTIDVKLPRTSREQSNYGTTIDRNLAQKGDLIFFSTNGSGHVNHVGMVVETLEDEIKFIHASVHSGVVISSTKESYYARCFIKVNRVLSPVE